MLLYQYLWNDADELIYLETFLKSIETFMSSFFTEYFENSTEYYCKYLNENIQMINKYVSTKWTVIVSRISSFESSCYKFWWSCKDMKSTN